MIYMLLIAFFIVVLDITGFKLDDDFSNIMYDIDEPSKGKEKSQVNKDTPSDKKPEVNIEKKSPKVNIAKKNEEAVPQDADSMLEEIYGKGQK